MNEIVNYCTISSRWRFHAVFFGVDFTSTLNFFFRLVVLFLVPPGYNRQALYRSLILLPQ